MANGVKLIQRNKQFVAPIAIETTPTEILNKYLFSSIRYEADDDTCVMSGCDTNHFPGFQLMYSTLMIFHDVKVVFVNLGIDNAQLHWCLSQPNISIIASYFSCSQRRGSPGKA